jgi:maleylacetate reductase
MVRRVKSFVYAAPSTRVVFGAGTLRQIGAEVDRLGCARALLLAGPRWGEDARQALGRFAAGTFSGAAMHTPVEVTETALAALRDHGADCVVAVGGGSTTGLAKAIALRTGVPQVIVPTTYAGSEVTAVVGETAGGRKTTRSSPAVLPETVLYDVELTLTLPVGLTVTSAVNAMAHAAEALYAPASNPVVDTLAVDAIARLARALPVVSAAPADVDARAELLVGAWLAGTCLGAVGMGLHHKLCHTLGGSFGLPHAATHAVVLPHALAYNAPAAPDAMRVVARALGVPDAPAGLYDLIAELGGPTSLEELGLAETDLPRAVALATATPYPNPREVTVPGLRELLGAAWTGSRPADGVAADLARLASQVTASFGAAPDPRGRQLLTTLTRALHDYVSANGITHREWAYAVDFLTRTGQRSDETRQEVILLSDVLGVSSAVDALGDSRVPGSTPSAVLGPFYTPDPPERPLGWDIAEGQPGVPLWVDLLVTGPDGDPVAGAVIDVWQSNADGYYDVQLPGLPGPALRARLRSGADGHVTFWSVLPVEYPIPVDGPVGGLLTAVGRHPYRAPHLHVLVEAAGYRRLVTQVFVSGGAYLDSDAVFGVKDQLIADFVPGVGPPPGGRRIDGGWRRLDWTPRLTPARR